MGTTIYYFSGTGNTLFVAKDIAAALGADLVPIVSLAGQDEIPVEADVAGIVYPVYYGDLPQIVRDFASKLANIGETYIFSICTFGGSAGESFTSLRTILEGRGGILAATYGVHMPQNAFYKFWEKPDRLFRSWRNKVKTVADNTKARKQGAFFTNRLFDLIFLGIQAYVRPRYKASFIRLSGGSEAMSVEELIRMSDASFRVTDACTGCGTCVKVCPAGNIELIDTKPVWQHRCFNCIACYNYCPVKAIRSGIAHEGYFYRHPDIPAKEIMGQRSSGR